MKSHTCERYSAQTTRNIAATCGAGYHVSGRGSSDTGRMLCRLCLVVLPTDQHRPLPVATSFILRSTVCVPPSHLPHIDIGRCSGLFLSLQPWTESQEAFNRVLARHRRPHPPQDSASSEEKLPVSAGLCASDIEMKIRLSQPTISHHMAVLQKAGLVEAKKEGLWRWYRRNEAALNAFTRKLRRTL